MDARGSLKTRKSIETDLTANGVKGSLSVTVALVSLKKCAPDVAEAAAVQNATDAHAITASAPRSFRICLPPLAGDARACLPFRVQ